MDSETLQFKNLFREPEMGMDVKLAILHNIFITKG